MAKFLGNYVNGKWVETFSIPAVHLFRFEEVLDR